MFTLFSQLFSYNYYQLTEGWQKQFAEISNFWVLQVFFICDVKRPTSVFEFNVDKCKVMHIGTKNSGAE